MCSFTTVMQAIVAVRRTNGRKLAVRGQLDGTLAVVEVATGTALATGSAAMVLWARSTLALLGGHAGRA